jgi:segregation and condensation protein A
MTIGIATFHTSDYKVATPIYEGPLDLLLQLIERAELDITQVALAQVTDQYLEHIKAITTLPAEEVSAFLVIAAKLVQIKSEALLPRPPTHTEEEEDVGADLARQLQEYKRYKKVAEGLAERQSARLHTYLRLSPSPKVIHGRMDLGGVDILDIVAAARLAFAQAEQAVLPTLSEVIAAPTISVRQKIHRITSLLRERGQIGFHATLDNVHSRLDVIVTFLAMLELIKRHWISVQQDKLFGHIVLQPTESWNEAEEFELEFGE